MTNNLLHLRCQECLKLDNGGCKGKTNDELSQPEKWTCSQFVFNSALLDEPSELVQPFERTVATDKQRLKDFVEPDAITVSESKHDKFLRLSQKRLDAVLEKMRILENLADNYIRQDGTKRYVYDFTTEDADCIINKLQNSVDNLKKSFAK
jgi:hypothetical protein